MAFRRTMPQDELRDSMTEEQRAQQATTYQASRGGYFPEREKPVPGTPKQED
jgi:hypothetical protein